MQTENTVIVVEDMQTENTVIVGEDIEEFALCAAIQAMKLWTLGVKSNRWSPKTIALRFKVKPGSAKTVLAQLQALK